MSVERQPRAWRVGFLTQLKFNGIDADNLLEPVKGFR